jgi:hypothetical protein
MATVAPSGNGTHASVPKNNGGTAIGVNGKGSDSQITKAIGVYQLANDVGADFGSKVVANDGTEGATTDSVGVAKAVSAGTLAFTPNATQWIVRGGNVSTTIGGVANTVLAGAGYYSSSVITDNIHQLTKNTLVGSGNGTFNFYARPSTDITPNYTKGAEAGNTLQFVKTDGTTAATDDAATPTRSVPGELTYRFGGPLPKQDDYKARNTRET